jgi:hypothetical protein
MEYKEQPVHSMTAIPETGIPEDNLRISGKGYTILMKRLPFVIPSEDRARGVP